MEYEYNAKEHHKLLRNMKPEWDRVCPYKANMSFQ